ncbi:MAG TPA: NAD(P)-dependent alcohol dehydrogenase [Acidimicrobiales bacterium]|nr:NAD(P)-dependent alcohol dehydrogenase [Acidimicrobiales bacterium]
MRAVTAYATAGPGAPFEKTTIERRDLGAHDVSVAIKFAGICHSDIHTARGEWGETIYPLVPGHEITGVVDAVGSGVTRHKVGDRVGVGVIVDSCRECASCVTDREQYCEVGATETYGAIGRDGRVTHGGYSTHVVVDQDFVFRIPDALGLDAAAPLLCAGITLYSPLRHWGAGTGKSVAIVGMGGLGHLGVQLAHAMGAEVTVLSHSLAKQEDGKRLGASAYYATSDPATFDALRGRFDLVVSTVSVPMDLEEYLSLLRVDGAFVLVGLPPEKMEFKAGWVATDRRTLAGSCIGGLAETQEMLDFCAQHGIGAEVEVVAASDIDAAWDRVVASDVRYRFVIDASTM